MPALWTEGSDSTMLSLSRVLIAAAFLLAGPALAGQPLALTVVSAKVDRDAATREPVLTIRLDAVSAKAFADFTGANVGRDVALLIGGAEAMRAHLVEAITGGLVQVAGTFTDRDLEDVAALIELGALAVAVETVDE